MFNIGDIVIYRNKHIGKIVAINVNNIYYLVEWKDKRHNFGMNWVDKKYLKLR